MNPICSSRPTSLFFCEAFGNGYTFGEAAWAAQLALSWQTTVIGDPLYQPFKKPPAELHAQLARAKSPLIEWSFDRLVNLDLAHGAARAANGRTFSKTCPPPRNSAVLTEKLADLYDAHGKPSSAIETWQNALKLNPSPEQRIRLRLTLGEKLQAQGRDAEAVENYQAAARRSAGLSGPESVIAKNSGRWMKNLPARTRRQSLDRSFQLN